MDDDLSDPLGIMNPDIPKEPVPRLNPFSNVIQSISRVLDDAVETTGATLARRKAPVKEFLAKGLNAPALVAKDSEIVPILVLEGEYTAQQLQGLGFKWETLLHGGLTEKNFGNIYGYLGTPLVTTFIGGLSDLLTLVQTGPRAPPATGPLGCRPGT